MTACHGEGREPGDGKSLSINTAKASVTRYHGFQTIFCPYEGFRPTVSSSTPSLLICHPLKRVLNSAPLTLRKWLANLGFNELNNRVSFNYANA